MKPPSMKFTVEIDLAETAKRLRDAADALDPPTPPPFPPRVTVWSLDRDEWAAVAAALSTEARTIRAGQPRLPYAKALYRVRELLTILDAEETK